MIGDIGKRLVVNFHGIGEPWEGVMADERPFWCPRATWPVFADALATIAKKGKVELEITFDDGNLSDIEEGMPALVERGLTATFHVCAGRLGRPRYLGVDHLRDLRKSGMKIGSHGWSHVDLRRVSDSELEREGSESQEVLAAAVGTSITQFAVPFGSYDRRVLRALSGYTEVYTSDRTRAPLHSWLTPRMSYVADWRPSDLERFAKEPYSIARRLQVGAKLGLKRLR